MPYIKNSIHIQNEHIYTMSKYTRKKSQQITAFAMDEKNRGNEKEEEKERGRAR